MSYPLEKYVNAEKTLLYILEKLERGEKTGYPDPTELKETLRIAAEASCFLSPSFASMGTHVGNIIRTLYLEKQPVSALNKEDVNGARTALSCGISKIRNILTEKKSK
jgi:uncharacterized radical SAM superfamily Fe-S cluster-containing enzyme